MKQELTGKGLVALGDKDKRTQIRDIDLHQNNIEVLWEWLAGQKYP